MTLQEVLDYFSKNYPQARVVQLPPDNPLELLCEIDPTQNHPNYSVAIAAIGSSIPHYHMNAIEEYEVIHGTLLVNVDGDIRTLYEREKITIPPRKVHAATSTDGYTLVKVVSQPGWQQSDHILAE